MTGLRPGHQSLTAVIVEADVFRKNSAEAQRLQRAARAAGEPVTPGVPRPKWVALRNGLPVPQPYTWRARRYPQAERVLAAAEAEHGSPSPTCLCGCEMRYSRDWRGLRCTGCGTVTP